MISPAFCSEDPDNWYLLGSPSRGEPLIVRTRAPVHVFTLDAGAMEWKGMRGQGEAGGGKCRRFKQQVLGAPTQVITALSQGLDPSGMDGKRGHEALQPSQALSPMEAHSLRVQLLFSKGLALSSPTSLLRSPLRSIGSMPRPPGLGWVVARR